MCKYKLDTGNDGNLMPIRMSKILFLQTNLEKLNKFTNKEIVLHVYNNSGIPQMGMCHTATFNEGIEH